MMRILEYPTKTELIGGSETRADALLHYMCKNNKFNREIIKSLFKLIIYSVSHLIDRPESLPLAKLSKALDTTVMLPIEDKIDGILLRSDGWGNDPLVNFIQTSGGYSPPHYY
ncbi:hypothetical protein VTL71DRAFT_6112 [Oculimacula yallundae]|uniref:Uncharacterized protein n=1 Tax=Oculimacula yallundae TaxID=86028 RepID=A0ABR4BZF4_9HELO